MKRSFPFVLSILSLMALAAGCAVPTGSDTSADGAHEPTADRIGTTSSALNEVLSVETTGGTCGAAQMELIFGGVSDTGGQTFVFEAHKVSTISQNEACYIEASLSLAAHYNLRITYIEVTGFESLSSTSGDVFTLFGLETAGFGTIGAESTADSGFLINYGSAAPTSPALGGTGTLACQTNPSSAVDLYVEPYIAGAIGSAAINSIIVTLQADPC